MDDLADVVNTRPDSTRSYDSDTMLSGNWSPCRDKVLIDLRHIRDREREIRDRDKR